MQLPASPKAADEILSSKPLDVKEISFRIESLESSKEDVSVPQSLPKKQLEKQEP